MRVSGCFWSFVIREVKDMLSSVTRGLVLAAIELCVVSLATSSEEVKTLGYNYDNDGSGLYRYS